MITETLFARPGIGRILVDAVNAKDMPVVLGVVIVVTAFYVLVNQIVDAVLPVLRGEWTGPWRSRVKVVSGVENASVTL